MNASSLPAWRDIQKVRKQSRRRLVPLTLDNALTLPSLPTCFSVRLTFGCLRTKSERPHKLEFWQFGSYRHLSSLSWYDSFLQHLIRFDKLMSEFPIIPLYVNHIFRMNHYNKYFSFKMPHSLLTCFKVFMWISWKSSAKHYLLILISEWGGFI